MCRQIDTVADLGLFARAGCVRWGPSAVRRRGLRCKGGDMPVFVLVHSPSVGPATWLPVAERLRGSGCAAVVPSLLAVGDGGAPFWARVVAARAAGLAGTGPRQPPVLVAPSHPGGFVPVLARCPSRPVPRS